MTLEQRLSDALHEVDGFEPSPDLFSRVTRSLDEDAAHRRRVGITWLATVSSFSTIAVYLGLLVTRTSTGLLVVPFWALELMETIVLVALVFVLAPVIRRFGKFYVADVFRLDPGTGERFMQLLEIAYYLVFFGGILQGLNPVQLDRLVQVGPGLETAFESIAVMLAVIGLFHAATLLGLPVVGLVFSSLVRRAERHRVGSAAPPEAPRAQQADRIASWVVRVAIGLLVLGAVLGVIGVIAGVGFGV